MEEKYYKTPNGTIVSLSTLKDKYKNDLDKIISQAVEINDNVYKTPNGTIVDESTLKNKYKDDFDNIVKQTTLLKKKVQSEPTSTDSQEPTKPLQPNGTGQVVNEQIQGVDNFIENAQGKLPNDSGFMANIGESLSFQKSDKPLVPETESVDSEDKIQLEKKHREAVDLDKRKVFTKIDNLTGYGKESSRKKLYSMDEDELQSFKDKLIDNNINATAIDEAINEAKSTFKREKDVLIVDEVKKKTKDDLINKTINKVVDVSKYEPQIFRRDAKPDITQPLGFEQKKTTIFQKLNEEDKKKVLSEANNEYNAKIDRKAYDLLPQSDKELAKNTAEFESVSQQLKDELAKLRTDESYSDKKSIELKEKLAELEKQRKELGARDRLYNPFTGQTIDRDKANDDVIQYNNKVNEIKAKLTDKDITKKVLEDNLLKLDYYEGKLNEKSPDGTPYKSLLDRFGWQVSLTDFITGGRKEEDYKYVQTLKKDYLDAKAKAQALSSAINTNQDPAAIKRGLFKESGFLDAAERGFMESMGMEHKLSEQEEGQIATKFTEALEEAGQKEILTKAQIENAKETFSEKLGYGTGASLPVMGEIIATTMLTEGIGGAIKIGQYLPKVKTLFGSEKLAGLFTNVVEQGVKGYITFAPTSESGATGVGEGITQALIPENLFKGKYSKLLEYGMRTLAGGTTESFQEYSGQYLDALADNGWDSREAFNRAFGRNPQEVWENALLMFAQSAMFSGAFNTKVLLSSRKEMQKAIDNNEVPTNEKQIVQEAIQKIDEKLSSENPKVITVKEGEAEIDLTREQLESKLDDTEFIRKVAEGETDIKIDNDTELGNKLSEKVEEYKLEKELIDDSKDETGLPSDEQGQETVVEEQPIETTSEETIEPSGDVQTPEKIEQRKVFVENKTQEFQSLSDDDYVNQFIEDGHLNPINSKREFLLRPDLGIPTKDVLKGIEDIKNSKNSASARNLKTAILKTKESGVIPMIQGTGGTSVKTGRSIGEFYNEEIPELNIDELNNYSSLSQTTKVAIDEGVTLENIDSLKDELFDGFPFTEEDFINVKQELENEKSRQQTSNAETKGISDESKTEQVDRKQELKNRIDRGLKEIRKGGLSTGGLQNLEHFVDVVAAYIELGYLNIKDIVNQIKTEYPDLDIDEKTFNEAKAIVDSANNLTTTLKGITPTKETFTNAYNEYKTNGGTLEYKEYLKAVRTHQKSLKTKPKTTTQKAVDKTVEGKMDKAEAKGLREQIKTLARGSKMGAKSQQELNKEVADLINEFKTKGKLDIRQVSALTRKALSVKVDNIKSQQKFAEYFNKLMDDADYDIKLEEAEKIIAKAKKQSKSKVALINIKQLAQGISTIDASVVEDIDSLLDVLREYNSDKPVPDERKAIENLQKFIDETNEYKEAKLKERTIESLKEIGYDEESLEGLTLDEMVKLISELEDLDTTQQDKLEAKKEVLRKAIKPVQLLLSNYDTTDLSDRNKAYLNNIVDADLDLLSLEDLKQMLIVGNNILINDNFSNSGNIAIKVNAIKDANTFSKTIDKNKVLKKGFWNNKLRSFQNIMDVIFGNHIAAAKASILLAEDKASIGRKAVREGVENYIEALSNLLNKFKINTIEDRVKITAAGLLLRYDGYNKLTEEEEFQKVKKDLSTNVENSKNNADLENELKDAEIALEFANQFETKKDLEDYLATNKGYSKAISHVQDAFANTLEEREAVSEAMYNNPLLRVAKNYIPKKIIRTDISTEEKPFDEEFKPVGLKQKQSGSINKAQAVGKLGKNRLNLDLLSYTSFELEKVLNEIHLSESRLIANTVLKQKEFTDKIGKSTANLIKDKLMLQYNPERGNNITVLNEVNNTLKQMATASVLGGFTQPIKQSSVIANISATLGAKGSAIFFKELATGLKNFKTFSFFNPIVTTKVTSPIHRLYPIGSRVEMNIGVDRGEKANAKRNKNSLHKGSSKIKQALLSSKDVITDLWLAPMHVQDIYISLSTWNAAYIKYLNDNGINDVDMKTEHLKIKDDKIRQEAAAYAEQIVGVTQIPSDAAQRAEVMKDGSTVSKITRGVLMPFSNFALNSLVRKVDAVKGLATKGRTAKAGQELSGLIAESAMFSIAKYGIAVYLYPNIVNVMYNALTGDDEDLITVDDEEKKKRFKMTRDFIIKDLLLQGLPDAVQNDLIHGYNKALYASAVSLGLTEDNYKDWSNKSDFSLYQYKGDKELAVESLGIYGIVPSKLVETFATRKLRKDGLVDGAYGERKVSLTEKEKQVLYIIEMVQWMNSFGFFDADATIMAKKAKSAMQKQDKSGGSRIVRAKVSKKRD